MRLIKDIENIKDEDKPEALKIINKLKVGDRVFGNPAEALKITLKNLEKNHNDKIKNKDVLDYLDDDDEFKSNKAKLKAGINGEETLAEYCQKIIKYDKELQDIIFFASLSDPEQNEIGEENGYIADSDFIAIYGNHLLILDAKNIVTSPEIPIYLEGTDLVSVGGKPILELHPSVYIWRNILQDQKVPYITIHGCVVIINNKGACIWRNQEWNSSEVKPLHISELVDYLHEWIKDKDPEVNLSLLIAISKMQVKKDTGGLDVRKNMKRFGI